MFSALGDIYVFFYLSSFFFQHEVAKAEGLKLIFNPEALYFVHQVSIYASFKFSYMVASMFLKMFWVLLHLRNDRCFLC